MGRLARCAWVLGIGFAVALSVPGCGSSGPRVVKVSGTVTRGGKPVNNLFLNFEPEHGRPSWGVTDAAGHYTLNYVSKGDGAETGKHKVWVQIRPSSPREEEELHNGTIKLHAEMREILKKYGKFETTPKVVEINENNQIVNLELD